MKPRERDITARYYQAGSPHSEINSDGYLKNFYRVIDKVLNQYFKGGIFVYVKKNNPPASQAQLHGADESEMNSQII